MTDDSAPPTPEEIEGLGLDEDGAWGDYPIDTVLLRNENRTVHDVLRRITQGSFVMDPDFQRDFIWPEDKQSRLIESVMMRIPLPVIYLAEDDEGRMIVVDGLQRLSTFQRFVENKLRLKLPTQPELHGKRFEDLSPKLKNRVEDCNLILYIIDAKVPERVRLDIFDRVNSGVPLARQQMRNSLFLGPATQFLKREAGSDLFLRATGGSLSSETMRDRELVNRFCAFALLQLEEYKGDMDDFLARALKRMNSLPADALADLSGALQCGLTNNLNVFGKHAFRKHRQGQRDRSVLNASLWDVMSTGLSHVDEPTVRDRADDLRAAFFQLMEDDPFTRAITYATNGVEQVKYRFEAVRSMLQEVFGAQSR